jgi:hypothetical protein
VEELKPHVTTAGNKATSPVTAPSRTENVPKAMADKDMAGTMDVAVEDSAEADPTVGREGAALIRELAGALPTLSPRTKRQQAPLDGTPGTVGWHRAPLGNKPHSMWYGGQAWEWCDHCKMWTTSHGMATHHGPKKGN